MAGELTVAILREIRDEIRSTNTRLDGVVTRLDGVVTRLDGIDHRMEVMDHRMEVMDHRMEAIETTVRDLAGQMLLTTRFLRHSTTRHDDAIEDLDRRVTRLEQKP